jgi:hypothetical protein
MATIDLGYSTLDSWSHLAPNWILIGPTGPGKLLEGSWGQNRTTFDPKNPFLKRCFLLLNCSFFKIRQMVWRIFFKTCNLGVKTTIFPWKFSGRSKVKSGPVLISGFKNPGLNNLGQLLPSPLRCPGETSDTYLTIDQKFISVVSTETESVKNKNIF